MHSLNEIVTVAAFPQCFVEVEDLGMYRVLPICSYVETENSPMRGAGQDSLISMIMRRYQVPTKIQPNAYCVIPVIESGGIWRQRTEEFFGHKLWTTLVLIVDEGGISTRVIGVQSMDEAGKRATRYNNAEIQVKVTDRGKAALAKAEELGLLREMEEIWKGMTQVFTQGE